MFLYFIIESCDQRKSVRLLYGNIIRNISQYHIIPTSYILCRNSMRSMVVNDRFILKPVKKNGKILVMYDDIIYYDAIVLLYEI